MYDQKAHQSLREYITKLAQANSQTQYDFLEGDAFHIVLAISLLAVEVAVALLNGHAPEIPGDGVDSERLKIQLRIFLNLNGQPEQTLEHFLGLLKEILENPYNDGYITKLQKFVLDIKHFIDTRTSFNVPNVATTINVLFDRSSDDWAAFIRNILFFPEQITVDGIFLSPKIFYRAVTPPLDGQTWHFVPSNFHSPVGYNAPQGTPQSPPGYNMHQIIEPSLFHRLHHALPGFLHWARSHPGIMAIVFAAGLVLLLFINSGINADRVARYQQGGSQGNVPESWPELMRQVPSDMFFNLFSIPQGHFVPNLPVVVCFLIFVIGILVFSGIWLRRFLWPAMQHNGYDSLS